MLHDCSTGRDRKTVGASNLPTGHLANEGFIELA